MDNEDVRGPRNYTSDTPVRVLPEPMWENEQEYQVGDKHVRVYEGLYWMGAAGWCLYYHETRDQHTWF